MESSGDLGEVVFSRRRAGRFGAFVCVALAFICGFLPALLLLSDPRRNTDSSGTAVGFVVAGSALLLLALRLAGTGLWFHERGVRRRGVLTSARHPYSGITGVDVKEFTTTVNGADAGYSVIIRYSADGKKHRIPLTGSARDPDADAIIALMLKSDRPGLDVSTK